MKKLILVLSLGLASLSNAETTIDDTKAASHNKMVEMHDKYERALITLHNYAPASILELIMRMTSAQDKPLKPEEIVVIDSFACLNVAEKAQLKDLILIRDNYCNVVYLLQNDPLYPRVHPKKDKEIISLKEFQHIVDIATYLASIFEQKNLNTSN